MDKPAIYPQRGVLEKLNLTFLEFCIECGAIHRYPKYKGWEKKTHIPLCYKEPEPGFGDKQQKLF
jgi:hypothetical protein